MIIENFKSVDINALVNCWNNALPHDTVTKIHFIKKLVFDVNFDPKGFFVAKEDGKILGFVNCVYRKVAIDGYSDIEPENAYISAFVVDNKERFDEIGNKLIDCVENYVLPLGKRKISTGYGPLYFYQGVSKEHCPEYINLFVSRGFTTHASLARDINLSNYVQPDSIEMKKSKLESEGFYVGSINDEYLYSLIDASEKFIGSGGAFEFKLRLSDFDFDRIKIVGKNGRVVGVCVFGDPMSSPERFGPFAVNPDYQGKGFGSVLMHECLTEMKKRGLHCAWMQWTPTTGVADAMYKKVGFEITKTYVTLIKRF